MLVLSSFFACAFAGCVNLKPTEDLTRFYALSASPRETPLAGAARLALPVFVAPVETPAYLDNPGMAMRRGRQQIEYDPLHHWAEPVRQGITRCLRHHLAALLGSDRMAALGPSSPAGDFVEVHVSLSRFELTADNKATLAADWRLVRASTGQVLDTGRSDIQRDYSGGGNREEAVAALSDAVADLSRQIAQALLSPAPQSAK